MTRRRTRSATSTAAAAPRPAARSTPSRSAASTEVPYRGVLPGTLTVPGAVASWTEAHAAYGRLPLKRCLDSAIGYARDGFPVTARLASWRDIARPELEKSPEAAAIFLPHGPVLKNPNLARTLEAIASDGWYGFYDGEVAKELVRWSQANDGFFTAGRPRGAAGALGRADRRHLSRRDDLRDAAADPGLRGARDAEPARAARPAQQAVPRPRLRASHDPGQADRLSRPRPPRRRPALRRRADRAPDLEILRRRAPSPHGPGARAAVGQGPVLRQPVRRHGLHRRRRQGGQRGLADPFALRHLRRGSRCRKHRRGPAEPLVLLLARSRRARTRSSRARRRCTR